MPILGVDIGGTHVTAARVHRAAAGFEIGPPQRGEVDASADAESILAAWCGPIGRALAEGLVEGIAVAMPGPFDYPRGICLIRGVAKYESLYGLNVEQALRRRLRFDDRLPMRFENDCNAFVLGEYLAGAARGARRVIGLTLGTGLGSGFLADGEIQYEGPGVPPDASLGFVPYRDGTAEDCISRRGLMRRYAELGGPHDTDVVAIAAEAARGDPLARQLFAELGRMLAEVLAPWVRGFRPDALVIGGAIARSFGLFEQTLAAGLPADLRVCPAQIADRANLLGAAALLHRRIEAG